MVSARKNCYKVWGESWRSWMNKSMIEMMKSKNWWNKGMRLKNKRMIYWHRLRRYVISRTLLVWLREWASEDLPELLWNRTLTNLGWPINQREYMAQSSLSSSPKRLRNKDDWTNRWRSSWRHWSSRKKMTTILKLKPKVKRNPRFKVNHKSRKAPRCKLSLQAAQETTGKSKSKLRCRINRSNYRMTK